MDGWQPEALVAARRSEAAKNGASPASGPLSGCSSAFPCPSSLWCSGTRLGNFSGLGRPTNRSLAGMGRGGVDGSLAAVDRHVRDSRLEPKSVDIQWRDRHQPAGCRSLGCPLKTDEYGSAYTTVTITSPADAAVTCSYVANVTADSPDGTRQYSTAIASASR